MLNLVAFDYRLRPASNSLKWLLMLCFARGSCASISERANVFIKVGLCIKSDAEEAARIIGNCAYVTVLLER